MPQRATEFWTINVRSNDFTVYKRVKGEVVARIHMMYPSRGEIYYLRLILLSLKPTSFLDARTVDGVVCNSYQDAAMHSGLLMIENEWLLCFQEALSEAYYSPQ